MTLDGRTNQLRRDRLVLFDRQPQRVLHGVLAVAGRQLQNLQILTHGDSRSMLLT